MKKLDSPISSCLFFQDIKQDTDYQIVFQRMIAFPRLHELRFSSLSFIGPEEFKLFLSSLDRFEKIINFHFRFYQDRHPDSASLRDFSISCKGYYVEPNRHWNEDNSYQKDPLVRIFVEIVPGKNHYALSTLYKKEQF